MNKERLLRLADLLEADAENQEGVKFDLRKWVSSYDDDGPKIDCGTTACAIGIAMLDPQFQAEGLGMVNTYEGSCHYIPTYRGYGEWVAVKEFFGLDESESLVLFLSDYYEADQITEAQCEKEVASRIRKFVEDKDAALAEAKMKYNERYDFDPW